MSVTQLLMDASDCALSRLLLTLAILTCSSLRSLHIKIKASNTSNSFGIVQNELITDIAVYAPSI